MLVFTKKIAEITLKQHTESGVLNLVGIVATIDNDFYGTEMTIGANSALHRIVECTDNIVTTAFRLIEICCFFHLNLINRL
jgi:6-phosphofructokinase 1